MIEKDYIIEAEVDCDPTLETCFIYECDPEAEECTGNPEEDTSYFKKAKRVAANIPLCDPADELCQPFVCGEGEKDCEEILCTEETSEEGDVCNNPEQYVLDNPIEDEEAVECDPSAAEAGESDEECLAAQEGEEVICEEGDEECAAVLEGDEAAEEINAGDSGEIENSADTVE
ncbi:MAG TPA: hypothetical protein DDW82_06695 [Acholeplasmataceae bacterium]|nr:hypothetical protein [Acholeplasmataceae bacterium]